MDHPDGMVVEFDRRGAAIASLGALAFVAVGVWLLQADEATLEGGRHSPLFVRLAGLGSVLFFGACLLAALRVVLAGRIALVLGPQGLDDRGSLVGAGLIPWSRVVGLRITTRWGQRILVVDVSDPESLVRSAPGWRRLAMRANQTFFDSPVAIALQPLKGVTSTQLLEACKALAARPQRS